MVKKYFIDTKIWLYVDEFSEFPNESAPDENKKNIHKMILDEVKLKFTKIADPRSTYIYHISKCRFRDIVYDFYVFE